MAPVPSQQLASTVPFLLPLPSPTPVLHPPLAALPQTTFDYVESRTSEPYEAVYSDDLASFFAGERARFLSFYLVLP